MPPIEHQHGFGKNIDGSVGFAQAVVMLCNRDVAVIFVLHLGLFMSHAIVVVK